MVISECELQILVQIYFQQIYQASEYKGMENAVSNRVRKQNLLKSKVSGFRTFYNESENRMKSRSSLTNLAGKLYSGSNNKQFKEYASPRKSSSILQRPSSATKDNPEKYKFEALKGLEMRASHVGSYAQINTRLLEEKKNLQNTIKSLKERIVQEKKKLNNADYNLKKNSNTWDKETSNYNQAHTKSQRLQQSIHETREERNNLNLQNQHLRKRIQITQSNILREENQINVLDSLVKKLKHDLMYEQKQRQLAKNDLTRELKVMSSASIYTKELENERANVLLQINKFVKESKI